ncbi:hypothetical protein [Marinomonas algicola]|uniref:hypothetical protein n=1 Tax=Marinomonas algicola TaxID=2773454 RepID=UPI00174DC365|nr:hypothetical protein [Marinomonas algicola]
MASIETIIEESSVSQRTNQITFKLRVKNSSLQVVKVLSIKPKLPEGAKLVEISDSSIATAKIRRKALLDDLNSLLKQYLLVTSEGFREDWVRTQREGMKRILSFSGLAKVYYHMLFGFLNFESILVTELKSINYQIHSSTEAKVAFDKWLSKSEQHKNISSIFEAKVEQLQELESSMSQDEKEFVASIQSSESIYLTYIIEFKRGVIDPKMYRFSVDVDHQKEDTQGVQNSTSFSNVEISPRPWCLSIIAMLSGALGVFIKNSQVENFNFDTLLLNPVIHTNIISASIVALIFFNIYEHTSLGKGFKLSLSWRSALFIGAITGLAQERIIAAFTALLGVG